MLLSGHQSQRRSTREWYVSSPLSACLVLVAMTVTHSVSAESPPQVPIAPGTVAFIDGTRIVDADLDQWLQAQDASAYQRVRREVYDGRRRALDALLADRLLSAEATRHGLTVEDLLESEVTRRAKPVSDADVNAFLSSNPVPAGATPSVVAPLVATLLRQRARETAKEEYLSALRLAPDARVQVFLEPPRVPVPRAAHNPTRGGDSAPVEIVMFSDFECPFCRRAEPVLARLSQRFPTEVQFVWRHYPLTIHQSARPAAEAAQCAHDQGQFWAYHDALFADPALLQSGGLVATAARLGLDADAFARCVNTHRHAAEIASDSEAGEQAGVSGTPTVFINGVAFVGALPYDVYERAVLDELARSGLPDRPQAPGFHPEAKR